MLEVTHQSLHWGMTTLLICLCTKAISEPRSSCHLLERQGWDEIGNVRLNLLSFSFILSLIALLLSPKKMHEKISIAGVCGLGLGLGKASPWGFILTGWTLRPTSLCPGAEGGQESRGVGRFADTPGGEFPFPRFPHFPFPSLPSAPRQLSAAERTVGWSAAPGTGGLLHCGASDTLGVSAKRSLWLCCTCDHMS